MKNAIVSILEGITNLGSPRRVDGNFTFNGNAYSYSAYTINQSSGNPIVRIDIKEAKNAKDKN